MPTVLLISPENFPDVVSAEQKKSASMKSHLGPELGSAILTPIAQGNYMGRSYALLPLKRNFSDNRVLWAMQRRTIKPQVIRWLRKMLSISTATKGAFGIYRNSLESLAEIDELDEGIKSVARGALDRLLNGQFLPLSTPMHNDLWKGNILLPCGGDGGSSFPFFVIDWRGSRIDGFPFFDLLRLSISFQMDPSELRSELESACKTIDCDFVDAAGYLAAALGEISSRRDQFPRKAFLQMADRCFSELQKVTG